MYGLTGIIPTAIVAGGTILLIVVIRLVLNRALKGRSGLSFKKQAITLGLAVAALVGLLIVIPVSDTLRGQLFTLFGIIISALIALSSSTIISNAMSGLILRSVRNFKPGDFIRVGDIFGRVSDRGLFHTEIQTIDRDLVTVPNHYLTKNPVTVTRSSGTFISVDVSLGYDVPREQVESLLLEAAEREELAEPFVHVIELGDFSVRYRVYGLLEDVKYLVGSISSFKKRVLDSLHGGGVEIVSPAFMNQRVLDREMRFVPRETPRTVDRREEDQSKHAEAVAFDKAEEAESLERLREKIAEAERETDGIKEELKGELSDAEREKRKKRIDFLEERKKRLAEVVSAREEDGGE